MNLSAISAIPCKRKFTDRKSVSARTWFGTFRSYPLFGSITCDNALVTFFLNFLKIVIVARNNYYKVISTQISFCLIHGGVHGGLYRAY